MIQRGFSDGFELKNEAAEAAFLGSAPRDKKCEIIALSTRNNGLGPYSLHHVQGSRVRHGHVLRDKVASRSSEEEMTEWIEFVPGRDPAGLASQLGKIKRLRILTALQDGTAG
jgi:hypothetical protein